MLLTIQTLQPKVPPLHRLSLGHPASWIGGEGFCCAFTFRFEFGESFTDAVQSIAHDGGARAILDSHFARHFPGFQRDLDGPFLTGEFEGDAVAHPAEQLRAHADTMPPQHSQRHFPSRNGRLQRFESDTVGVFSQSI